MKDIKIREAFRSLVRHLNLRVDLDENDYYWGYSVGNNPPEAGCNLARKEDIMNLQRQIDKLTKSKSKKK